ncbi:hypothetical protein [Cellvibrio fontiphilus]|uniref:MAE-28990/MAE-18760-like HEPN domain-containing protein n=1 Tax=Cellvibrio fontiphilus TaxID=1815559 RepID=A0ABV7FL58_9GAMM
MEKLKALNELCKMDARQSVFPVRDEISQQWRKRTQEETYERISKIQLHENVPEDIRSHFSASLNLLAYSWYCYQFNGTAEFMALVSVEFSLKKIYPSNKYQKFPILLRRAADENLLKDENFKYANQSIEGIGAVHLIPPMYFSTEKTYVETLVEYLPKMRNSLAHGVISIHNFGIESVFLCSEIINQLFASPETDK